MKLLNQNETAKLEFSWKDGKLNGNISHDMGDNAEASPTKAANLKRAFEKGIHVVSSSQKDETSE